MPPRLLRKAAEERKQRGLAHPILLLEYRKLPNEVDKKKGIEFIVLGTTATYAVTYSKESSWKCLCPDFARRQKFCKHIYFVLARVLQKDVIGDDLAVQSSSMYYDDVDDMYRAIRDRVQQAGTIQNPNYDYTRVVEKENEKERNASEKQRPYIGEACCFCLDTMTEACMVVYCQQQCGKSVHYECFRRYIQTVKKKNSKCPYCRSDMKLQAVPSMARNKTKVRDEQETKETKDPVADLDKKETKEQKETKQMQGSEIQKLEEKEESKQNKNNR